MLPATKSKQRMNWTNENIAEAIMAVANQFDPPRMPSKSEIEMMCGDYSLSNAISKHGGFNYWANKLSLEQKYSETSVGIQGEVEIARRLQAMGYEVEQTSVKHPYDLLVDGCVKIDVKTANTSYARGCPIHAYRLAKRQHTCDLYIFYEADTDTVYVVPANKCTGQIQVEMGGGSKKYLMYHNAYHLIGTLRNTFKRM